MSENLILSFLIENTSCSDDIVPEHGLAIYVEYGEFKGLYDCGQTDIIIENAYTMEKDLMELDWIALSHGHYDHCGGLTDVLMHTHQHIPLHFGKGALQIKHAIKRDSDETYANGCNFTRKDLQYLGVEVHEHQEPCAEICKDIYLVGPAPMKNKFEKTSGRFLLKDKNGEFARDDFSDERSLVIDTPSGLIILTGCAHRGPLNILAQVQELFDGKRIRALIGGFHLNADSDELLDKKVEEFRKLDLDAIGLAHCTGGKASRYLREMMPEKCFLCPAGAELEFDL